jgi:hypothetical protein
MLGIVIKKIVNTKKITETKPINIVLAPKSR